MTRHLVAKLLLGLTMAATIGCDRVTKHVATIALAGNPDRVYLSDVVRLTYVENTGGFLSLGAALPPTVRFGLFTIGAGLTLIAAMVIAVASPRGRWTQLGLTLLVAGGASNWIDRLTNGRVVDFLNVGVGPVRTGVFNVADMSIMIGAAILVVVHVSRIAAAGSQSDPQEES